MITWFIYAILAALFISGRDIATKKALFKEHSLEFSTIAALFVLILSVPFFFFIDFSQLPLTPIIILFFTTILGATGLLLIAKSIKHMEISSVTPLFILSPAITSVLAFIFLGEILTFNQVSGIVLLLFGAYILETKNHLLEPLRIFKTSKYVWYTVLGLLIFGVTAVFDRVVLFHYDLPVLAYLAFVHLFLALHFTIFLKIAKKTHGLKDIKDGIKTVGWWILLVACITVAARFAHASAVKIAFVGLVVAIKRMSSLVTIIFGGELFHEKNLVRKASATIIMILGMLLIVLWP